MSTIFETSQDQQSTQSATSVLREEFTALKLSFTWWGTRRSLSSEQKTQAAQSFQAQGDYLSASKKLIDTKNEEWKALTAQKGLIRKYWESVSLPYPEDGIRLVRIDNLESIIETLQDMREELGRRAAALDVVFWNLRERARYRLGDLFNESDYPYSVADSFNVSWDVVSVDLPDYLQTLNPRIFAEQSARVRERFNQAVELAETAFASELSKLVSHLVERISGGEDGKPKTFRDSAIDNFGEFFSRFRRLNIGSNQQIDDLVTECEQILRGRSADDLRNSSALRGVISSQLNSVSEALGDAMQNIPRRRVDRG